MRLAHFDSLEPVCASCRISKAQERPLKLAKIAWRQGDTVIEGILHCLNADCRLEYPIIDGIPLLFPDIRSYIADNIVRWGLLETGARGEMLAWQHGRSFSLDAAVRIAADDRDGFGKQ